MIISESVVEEEKPQLGVTRGGGMVGGKTGRRAGGRVGGWAAGGCGGLVGSALHDNADWRRKANLVL